MDQETPTSYSQDTLIRRIIRSLEKNQFQKIRASYTKTPYALPKKYYGHMPVITGHDTMNQFYIFEISLDDYVDNTTEEARCIAFAKHAALHQAQFIWFVPTGKKDNAITLATKWKILSKIKHIKEIDLNR